MEGTPKRPWSDLPPELLSMIGSRLQTRTDVLWFRSVCSSFRTSIPLPAQRFPFRIPCSPVPDLFLRESTVYTLETPADGAASNRARCLVKLRESDLGNMRILSLFSRRPVASLPLKFREVLDSLQFRMVEVCREYTLEYDRGTGAYPIMKKVVVHPDCVWTDLDQCSVYFIDQDHLCYWKYGDETWSHLGRGYDDIVVYEGKVCVVDKMGSVSQIDSSFGLRHFSPPIDGGNHGGSQKRLVVSSGNLYVVDIRIRGKRRCDFRVYRLDQQCGRWEEVRSLGNSAFFLCSLCSFAVSARELDGCEGDCIYYVSRDVKVFSLADRSHKSPDFLVYCVDEERLLGFWQ
ncbi:putative F-box protein At5g60060 [Rhodamnia argentea]|uniref:F-box protein At5g60060 n=1 Tax=Rhodamnia argentea TaxID=178133 RepID=A0A8B8PM60_9MYRT|nr:putative F-box protein At5g60060 [Rhodamnia argentea]